MTDRRELHADNDVMDPGTPTPSQGGSSGGDMAREIGSLDEEKATGADPQPTSVNKGMNPDDGDEANLPNRQEGGEGQDKAPPRRT